MRVFDLFISGAVALLYAQLASDKELSSGIFENYDPARDSSIGIAFSLNGDWFINWPFIFTTIATICFIAALLKLFRQDAQRKEAQNSADDD